MVWYGMVWYLCHQKIANDTSPCAPRFVHRSIYWISKISPDDTKTSAHFRLRAERERADRGSKVARASGRGKGRQKKIVQFFDPMNDVQFFDCTNDCRSWIHRPLFVCVYIYLCRCVYIYVGVFRLCIQRSTSFLSCQKISMCDKITIEVVVVLTYIGGIQSNWSDLLDEMGKNFFCIY